MKECKHCFWFRPASACMPRRELQDHHIGCCTRSCPHPGDERVPGNSVGYYYAKWPVVYEFEFCGEFKRSRRS